MKRNDASPRSLLGKLCRSFLSLALVIGICMPTFAFGMEQGPDDIDASHLPGTQPVPASEEGDSSSSMVFSVMSAGDEGQGEEETCPICGTMHDGFGYCGDAGSNVAWCYSGTTLTISGTGNMADYAMTSSNVTSAPWASYSSTMTSVVVQDGVTSIGSYSFYRHTKIASVSFPDSVTIIGPSACYKCTSLSSFHLPPNVKEIGEMAFYRCTSLPNIQIPSCIELIGAGAFYMCYNIGNQVFPECLRKIDAMAFSHCKAMTKVELPYLTTEIGGYAFQYCSGVTQVTLPEGITEIPDGMFSGTAIASYDFPPDITRIGNNAFESCSKLTSITIPDTVTSLGSEAFAYSGLTSIELPGSIKSAGYRLFMGCSKLETVVFGEGFGTIGGYAFKECTSLKSVNLPDDLTSIPDYMFYKCSSLESIVIPETVTSFGNYSFSYCGKLASLNLPSSLTSIGLWALEDCKSLPSVVIPAGVQRIEQRTFCGCDSFEYLVIPSTVTYVGDLALCAEIDTIIFEGTPTIHKTATTKKDIGKVIAPAGFMESIESNNYLKKASEKFEFVSKVNGEYYATVAEAAEAANGETVKMYADAVIDDASLLSGDVEIDLNGHSLSISGGEFAALSVKGGKLEISGGTFKGAIAADNTANVAISGGRFAVQPDLAYLSEENRSEGDGFVNSEGYYVVGKTDKAADAERSAELVADGEAMAEEPDVSDIGDSAIPNNGFGDEGRDVTETLESVSAGFGKAGHGGAFTGGSGGASEESPAVAVKAASDGASIGDMMDQPEASIFKSDKETDDAGKTFPLWIGGIAVVATAAINFVIFRRRFGF